MVKSVRASFLSGSITTNARRSSNASTPRAFRRRSCPAVCWRTPLPGTGQSGVEVRRRADGCPFATARALDLPPRSSATVAGYPSWPLERSPGALSASQLAAEAARPKKVGARSIRVRLILHPLRHLGERAGMRWFGFRSHPARRSLRAPHQPRERPSDHHRTGYRIGACLGDLSRSVSIARQARWQTARLGAGTRAPATMLVSNVGLTLRVWASAAGPGTNTRRLPAQETQRLTPAFQRAARRFPPRFPQNSSFVLSLRSLPFRSLNPAETGGRNLAWLARIPRR